MEHFAAVTPGYGENSRVPTSEPPEDGSNTWRMKRDPKKPKQKRKLSLAKESVRRLAVPDLSNVAGGGQTAQCDTITLKCCLTR